MMVSILIATRNHCSALIETLRSLDSIPVPVGMSVEVVVIDNGSSDDTFSLLSNARFAAFDLKCLQEERKGKALALNTGLDAVTGEIIILTDDDVRPDREWLKAITDPILDQRFAALAGVVRIAPHLLRPWMTKTHLAWLASTHYLDPAAPEAALGANMAFSRNVLRDVPRFDPELGPGRLGFWEDTLFSFQLRSAGHKLGMASGAAVEHHFEPSRLSRVAFLARAKCEGQSSAYVAWHWKHEEQPDVPRQLRKYKTLLLLKRLCRWRDWRRTEGIAEWEMNLAGGIAFCEHYNFERRRPRAYAKCGLHKLNDRRSESVLTRP